MQIESHNMCIWLEFFVHLHQTTSRQESEGPNLFPSNNTLHPTTTGQEEELYSVRRNRYSAIKAKIARRCGRIRANGSLQQLVPRANAFSWAQKGPPRESTKKNPADAHGHGAAHGRSKCPQTSLPPLTDKNHNSREFAHTRKKEEPATHLGQFSVRAGWVQSRELSLQ